MGAHFPLDVLVGYFFGFLAGILGNYLFKFIPWTKN
jgi:membrane-associated phospholipid phosphatase